MNHFMKGFRDRIKGGRADSNKPSDFPQDQIQMGIQIEQEHTKDRELAREIAMDHLKEDRHYYSKLKKAKL